MKRNHSILLLNREAPAWMGMWNGVGGKLTADESPMKGILREIAEETGLQLSSVSDKGAVTWVVDGSRKGGMYLFVAELASDMEYATPRGTREGILDWKRLDWILHPDNQGVAANIPYFLPLALEDSRRYEHRCTFENGRLVGVDSIIWEGSKEGYERYPIG